MKCLLLLTSQCCRSSNAATYACRFQVLSKLPCHRYLSSQFQLPGPTWSLSELQIYAKRGKSEVEISGDNNNKDSSSSSSDGKVSLESVNHLADLANIDLSAPHISRGEIVKSINTILNCANILKNYKPMNQTQLAGADFNSTCTRLSNLTPARFSSDLDNDEPMYEDRLRCRDTLMQLAPVSHDGFYTAPKVKEQ